MKKDIYLWIGAIILIILGISYFITITKYGANYEIEDKLLGIIIFHNLYVLIAYIAIALSMIIKGFVKFNQFNGKKKRKDSKNKSRYYI